MGKADLHIHTNASDGRLNPEDVPELARQNGLETIAITDHDTLAGYAPAKAAADSVGVEVLSGVELTCDFNGRESHLLAYCFEAKDSGIQQLIKKHKKARVERIKWIVDQLKAQGLDLETAEVKAEAAGSNPGRPHVAAVLVNKGYVASHKEAFIRYLGNHVLAPIKNFYTPHTEVVRIIKEAGGATVLAHPNMLYSKDELQQWIDDGLDGLEVIHPSHDYEQQKKFQQLAETNNLLITGGSDYHGSGDHYLRYFGVVNVGLNRVEQLKRMTAQRKKITV